MTSAMAGSKPELQQRRQSHYVMKQTVLVISIALVMYQLWRRSISFESYEVYSDGGESISRSRSQSRSQSQSQDPRAHFSKDRYPYIAYDLMAECGLADANVTDRDPYVLRPSPILNTSMAFVKTHKTGSSTLANMIWRWVHARDLKRMKPRTGKNLGWPETFPGKKRFFAGKKFDAIYNHAVYNKRWYDEYLRNPGTTFTILREPMARTISAVNYYLDKTPYNFRGWNFVIHRYRNKNHKMQTYDFYTHNSMAYDLGWYEQHNASIEYDFNVEEIQAFIDELDKNIDVVMIVERMEESLLLLRDQIPGISVSELVLHSANVNGNNTHNEDTSLKKLYPSEDELKELTDIMLVDRMIYDHFNQRLDREWNAKVQQYPHFQQLKEGLTCLQKKVDANFDNEEVIS
eukprot:CAMPEP_0197185040 /NCGR_PEP_ID=MMETSP1423-20130617/11108_1 /TAXON_ID=476441 /ORGANISM="Pseudo-nitzschia heimii, Strain UNC1101" /LENGTH=403 /DNA_ID=CAMNT_0042636003 /DNA_START=75 /DNA_END=1282 /DNA_ORIENTATION=-